MSAGAPEARVPGIVRRYVAADIEDVGARSDSLRDLGDALAEIVGQAETETVRDQSVSLFATVWEGSVGLDAVAIESARKTDQSIECEGRLWLLGSAGESFSLPLHATFSLSAGGDSVSSYEIKISNAVSFGQHFDERLRADRSHRYLGPEFDGMRERLDASKEWVITIRKGSTLT